MSQQCCPPCSARVCGASSAHTGFMRVAPSGPASWQRAAARREGRSGFPPLDAQSVMLLRGKATRSADFRPHWNPHVMRWCGCFVCAPLRRIGELGAGPGQRSSAGACAAGEQLASCGPCTPSPTTRGPFALSLPARRPLARDVVRKQSVASSVCVQGGAGGMRGVWPSRPPARRAASFACWRWGPSGLP